MAFFLRAQGNLLRGAAAGAQGARLLPGTEPVQYVKRIQTDYDILKREAISPS